MTITGSLGCMKEALCSTHSWWDEALVHRRINDAAVWLVNGDTYGSWKGRQLATCIRAISHLVPSPGQVKATCTITALEGWRCGAHLEVGESLRKQTYHIVK